MMKNIEKCFEFLIKNNKWVKNILDTIVHTKHRHDFEWLTLWTKKKAKQNKNIPYNLDEILNNNVISFSAFPLNLSASTKLLI